MNNQSLYGYCLRLGDDALVHSYRLSEWCSFAPTLEEDLALTNFALDLTGRAAALLAYAGQVEGRGRTDDDLAYRRPEKDFCNHLIYELPKGNFAFTIARLLLTSAYDYYLYTELAHSADATLAAIAAKSVKEARYHMAHTRDRMLRLGDGTGESHMRAQEAIDELWPYTGELFETGDGDGVLRDANIAVDLSVVKSKWKPYIFSVLDEATLVIPGNEFMHGGGIHGRHTEHLGHILCEMQYLQRAYPDAIW